MQLYCCPRLLGGKVQGNLLGRVVKEDKLDSLRGNIELTRWIGLL